MRRYYLDDADVDSQRRLFEEYAAEAQPDARRAAAGAGAHVRAASCSHAFNVLDARGAVSTTERAKAFGRMRRLAREVAQLWAERRDGARAPAARRSADAAALSPPPAADRRSASSWPAPDARVGWLRDRHRGDAAGEVTKTAEAVRAGADREARPRPGSRTATITVHAHAAPRSSPSSTESARASRTPSACVRGPR